MKSFLEYISEDIELIPIEKSNPSYNEDDMSASDVHKRYREILKAKEKKMGEIHPGYDLYKHTRINRWGNETNRIHYFTIVHRDTNRIVGNMGGYGGKIHPIKGFESSLKGKGIRVFDLHILSGHSKNKLGKSLAVEMYRHLHRKGYGIQSDSTQSHGAADVWNTMRHDPELKKHMMIHDRREPLRGERHTFIKNAYKYPESHIWHQFSSSWNSEIRPKVQPQYGTDRDYTRTLILSGKKKYK